MPATLIETPKLVWDLTRESPTLGGALVLRQEGELLASLHTQSSITLHLVGDESVRKSIAPLAASVFNSSAFTFHLTDETPSAEAWPMSNEREAQTFSYFSFSRLVMLHQKHGVLPRLKWASSIQEKAQAARARFTGRLVCLHLRSVPPFTPEDSNADGPTWHTFLATHARAGALDFLLLGDDPLPTGLALGKGVSRAKDLGLDLSTQLALISLADGFLAMASGLCTAANLSSTPHVIFKHPSHHAASMARELGASDSFTFADPHQQLWRRPASLDMISQALYLILS